MAKAEFFFQAYNSLDSKVLSRAMQESHRDNVRSVSAFKNQNMQKLSVTRPPRSKVLNLTSHYPALCVLVFPPFIRRRIVCALCLFTHLVSFETDSTVDLVSSSSALFLFPALSQPPAMYAIIRSLRSSFLAALPRSVLPRHPNETFPITVNSCAT